MNFWDNLMGDDEGASTYMATYGEGPGFETRHVVGSFINNGETVLDVGCGPGWNLDHFIEYGPMISKYKGLDYSERFVRVANERWKLSNFLNVHTVIPTMPRSADPFSTEDVFKMFDDAHAFHLGDARDLKEPNESWDVVILQDCLEHTNGYEIPVLEALRVARKRVIITFWHLEGNEGTEHINNDGNDGWGAWYDKRLWEKFLNNLPYVWHETEVAPEGKTHKWAFYIIDKEDAR